MHYHPDSFLLEKLKEGDMFAFNAFFIKYYKLLLVTAYFYLKDEQEAKDIVQDFLFEFWHKKFFLKLEGEIKGYLYTSVKNKCLNAQKKNKVERERLVVFEHTYLPSDDYHRDKERQFALLLEAMNHLPRQRREVLYRVYLKEKKYQEAADELGISLNTVKTHLKIGLKHLREKLKKIH
ncbi:MAG: sigma-70 family RNA polymerase sigma factor [Chitinophagaceae bacterium]|nr:sigma-70 family RNA polymerase sigma factor [Chitinophagaceae bacterium]